MNEQQPFLDQNGQQPIAAEVPAERLEGTNAPIIEWQASEYVHHSKGIGWLAVYGVVTALFVGLTIWMRAWTFLALVVVMAIAFLIFAFRKPHVLNYRLDKRGLYVHDKFYPYADFKSYGLLQDGAIFSIMLIPAKRLMPALLLYFEDKDGEKIVDTIGAYLPRQEVKLDLIDRLSRKLHF